MVIALAAAGGILGNPKSFSGSEFSYKIRGLIQRTVTKERCIADICKRKLSADIVNESPGEANSKKSGFTGLKTCSNWRAMILGGNKQELEQRKLLQ